MNQEILIKLLKEGKVTNETINKISEGYLALSEEEQQHLQQALLSDITKLVKDETPYKKGNEITNTTPLSKQLAKQLATIIEQTTQNSTKKELISLLSTAIIAATQAEIQQIDTVNMYANTKSYPLSDSERISLAIEKLDLQQQVTDILTSEALNTIATTVEQATKDYENGNISSVEYHHILKTEQVRGTYLTAKQELQQLKTDKSKKLLQYGAAYTISSRAPIMSEEEQDQINNAISYQESITTIYQAKLNLLQGSISQEEANKTMGQALDVIIDLNTEKQIQPMIKTPYKK